MLNLILLVPASALLVLGSEGLYHAVRSRQEVAIACDQFARERPSTNRVRVTGCEIDYAAAGYRESSGHIEELFLPARPAGAAVSAPIVVATRNASAIALVQGVVGGGRASTPEQSLAVMQKVVAVMQATTSIDGLVRAGFIERFRSQRIVSGLAAPVAANAVIVDLRGTPDFLRPSLALVAGLLLALIPLRLSRRAQPARDVERQLSVTMRDEPAASVWYRSEEFSGVNPPPAASAAVPKKVIPVTLPRLLLLNLGVSSGPEAIETAPPLGTRDEVVAILFGVIPDLDVDNARGLLMRQDDAVRLDLGLHDPVPTAVVEARGEAGVALVKEILLMTGWRAFAPKTGLFVSAADLDALAALAGGDPGIGDRRSGIGDRRSGHG